MFVEQDIAAHLAANDDSDYPEQIVADMKMLGVFSAGISRSYGGLGLSPDHLSRVIYEMARGWQSLAGLLGSHYRACACIAACGTDKQKDLLLGEVVHRAAVFAYAHKEDGLRDPMELRTTAVVRGRTGLLTGTKHWVTNGSRATHMLVIAHWSERVGAIVVNPHSPGVALSDEIRRPGMRGASLNEVEICSYEFDPVLEAIGGPDFDIGPYLHESMPRSSLTFAARSVASAEALNDWIREYLKGTLPARPPTARAAISLRLGELATWVFAMRSAWQAAVRSGEATQIYQAKVFCSSMLQKVIELVAALGGGRSFAGLDPMPLSVS
jgi:alkylation response protein AidB-like acyl-CoA dehydrogenase